MPDAQSLVGNSARPLLSCPLVDSYCTSLPLTAVTRIHFRGYCNQSSSLSTYIQYTKTREEDPQTRLAKKVRNLLGGFPNILGQLGGFPISEICLVGLY